MLLQETKWRGKSIESDTVSVGVQRSPSASLLPSETSDQVERDGGRPWLPINGVLDPRGSLARLNPSRVPVQDRQVEATPQELAVLGPKASLDSFQILRERTAH